jgi:hypothetical protein
MMPMRNIQKRVKSGEASLWAATMSPKASEYCPKIQRAFKKFPERMKGVNSEGLIIPLIVSLIKSPLLVA